MIELAPEELNRLEATYPLTEGTLVRVNAARHAAGLVLRQEVPGLLAIVGPCAMTEDREIIDREGDALHDLEVEVGNGLVVGHRLCRKKDRTPKKRASDPEPWRGMASVPETFEAAYRTIAERAAATANVAAEIMDRTDITLHGHHFMFAWTGARRVNDTAGLVYPAAHRWGMPIGVKNALDGNTASAQRNVAIITQTRQGSPRPAPAVLIYRGGENAKTPEAWDAHYRELLIATQGRLMVDAAHSTMRAFNPGGRYEEKTVEGQVAAMNHIIKLVEEDEELPMPIGILLEASDAESPVDPGMPFRVAYEGVRRLHTVKMARLAMAA